MDKINSYSLVDPFWGNGAVSPLPAPGIVRGWNWLKAQTGNTHPGAQLPLGWVTACPYSGAYPTGYGKNGCSSDGPAPQVFDRKAAWGITHFHLSGTGFVGQFYNYFLCTPYSDKANLSHISDLINEKATPGYYSGTLENYGADFELTTSRVAAAHRYSFHDGHGNISIDLNTIGLRLKLGSRYNEVINWNSAIKDADGETWKGFIVANGMYVWFALKVKGSISKAALYNSVIEYKIDSSNAELYLGISLKDMKSAVTYVKQAYEDGFDNILTAAKQEWTRQLGHIRAEFPSSAEQSRFYSCLYHSIVKPVKSDDGYIDFMTMWDTYRTQLPLLLSITPEHARDMLLSMLDTIEKLGFFPILYFMSASRNLESNQASALVIYTLCDGFTRGILTAEDYPRLKQAFIAEFKHANYYGKSPTHILDISGALRAASFVAEACGDSEYVKHLLNQSSIWSLAYDKTTGYLIQDAVYYEGNFRNYSFRAHTDMQKRIELAGGTARFNEMLDDFFAVTYNEPYGEDPRPIRNGYFEGMNNESDMETPYTYLWCGRADRVAEINSLIRKYQFTDGEGGAPGNVDSGALSSWYVLSCLGIYPLTGTPYYLLGSPSVTDAEIDMTQGTLHISVTRESPDAIYPTAYTFNGQDFSEPWLLTSEIEKGGTLVFHLADKPSPGLSPIPKWL